MSADDIKRLNYYERQYLRTQDFKDEQAYHVKMRRDHLLGLHTSGIVKGLEITQDKKTKLWSLQPGMAVDEFGREIIVPEAQELDIAAIQSQLGNLTSSAKLNLWIAYELEASDDAAPGYKACHETEPFNRIQETYRLIYQNPKPKHTSKFQPQSKASVFDDPREQVAPVYLGTIVWGTDPKAKPPKPAGIQGIEYTSLSYNREYLGNITSHIQVPGLSLLIRSMADLTGLIVSIKGAIDTLILRTMKLDIAGSFRVNEGTIFSNIQAGTAKVGPSPKKGIVFKTITITFPKKFDRIPMVIVTARTQHGQNYDDTFAVTTKNISQSEFSVNVFRVDKKEAWAQELLLDWFAWEKVSEGTIL